MCAFVCQGVQNDNDADNAHNFSKHILSQICCRRTIKANEHNHFNKIHTSLTRVLARTRIDTRMCGVHRCRDYYFHNSDTISFLSLDFIQFDVIHSFFGIDIIVVVAVCLFVFFFVQTNERAMNSAAESIQFIRMNVTVTFIATAHTHAHK